MLRERVAYLGPVFSYSHQAAIQRFSENGFEHVPFVTFHDIFNAVQSSGVSFAILPVENSTNGSVVGAFDLLADRSNEYPDVLVCGEVYVDVRHYLFGSPIEWNNLSGSRDIAGHHSKTTPRPPLLGEAKRLASPLMDLQNIDRIYSHPQVWGQCDLFLERYLKGVERKDTTSTSKAAQLVRADPSGKSAAISSLEAGIDSGLIVLAERIEDAEDNITRFFVLHNRVNHPRPDISGSQALGGTEKSKSLMSFSIDHESPGAIADVLDCFRRNRLNLTSINSRPSRVIPFQYIFFVEFEGSKFDDAEGLVSDALDNASKVSQRCRWLGSWNITMHQQPR